MPSHIKERRLYPVSLPAASGVPGLPSFPECVLIDDPRVRPETPVPFSLPSFSLILPVGVRLDDVRGLLDRVDAVELRLE